LEAQGLGGSEVDSELKLGRLHHRQIGGLFTLENAARIGPAWRAMSKGTGP
jgi:hypothetical protein